jgi:hypothetical protein
MTKYLAIDPSGNYVEGKGKTGWAMYVDGEFTFGTFDAKDFETRVDYWYAVAMLIAIEKPTTLIIEDYRLYNTRATSAATQSFSLMETPRLLGVLEQTAQANNIPQVIWQMASSTKAYSDDKLLKLGILSKPKNRHIFKGYKLNDHERSAFRHLLRMLDKEGVKYL